MSYHEMLHVLYTLYYWSWEYERDYLLIALDHCANPSIIGDPDYKLHARTCSSLFDVFIVLHFHDVLLALRHLPMQTNVASIDWFGLHCYILETPRHPRTVSAI